MEDLAQAFARRAIERSTADREASYVEEIRRLVDATYRLIAKTGGFDPPMRDILKTAGVSTQAFYRHFRTKDELMLVLLDDGRRRLIEYLEHRMGKAQRAEDRVRAWIEGVLAQAADPRAAKRTKPFVVNQDRLTDRFPAEQQASFDLLIEQLMGPLKALPAARPTRHDAEAIYHATFGSLRAHLIRGTRPAVTETDHLVEFCLAGVSKRRLRAGRRVSR